MVFKKYHLLMCFALVFTMAVSLVVFSVPTTAAPADEVAVETDVAITSVDAPEDAGGKGKSWTGNGNRLDLSKLRFGDIISVKGVIVIAGAGEWWMGYSHTAIYIGNGKMIEAFADGVRISSTSMVRNADCARIDRVSTSYSKKVAAVNFMKKQIGKPYDYRWLTYFGGKQVYGSSYYCSELAWAGFKVARGPDIDRYTGYNWRFGFNVAPQEIVDDGNTYKISYSS